MDENEENRNLEDFLNACAVGHYEECESWILKGMPVNSRNRFDQTAIMVATVSGRLETVKLLLKHQADPMMGDIWGYNALMKAAACGHTGIFKLLWNHTGSVTCNTFIGSVTAVTEAATNGNNDIIRMCLAQDDQLVDIPVELTGMTPLMLAVVGGHQATVEMLLKNKAKVDVVSSASQTAVDMALQLMDEGIIETLKDYARRSQGDVLHVTPESNKTHKKELALTPTSRFPTRIEGIKHLTTLVARRSKSKQRPKAKKSITSKSDEIFRFILQSEGLENLWEIFTDHEIDLKTFFALTSEDFTSIGISDEQTIVNLMTVSHHYKPLFSI